jgi:hypothetical protein
MGIPAAGIGNEFTCAPCVVCKEDNAVVIPNTLREVSPSEETMYNVTQRAFQCLHRDLCKDCLGSYLASNVGTQIYVEGNNVKVLVDKEATCPTCNAFPIGSQLEHTVDNTVKIKGTTGLLNGDPNLSPAARSGSTTSAGAVPKKWSKKTIAKVALASLAIIAVLAAILLAVMLVV